MSCYSATNCLTMFESSLICSSFSAYLFDSAALPSSLWDFYGSRTETEGCFRRFFSSSSLTTGYVSPSAVGASTMTGADTTLSLCCSMAGRGSSSFWMTGLAWKPRT